MLELGSYMLATIIAMAVSMAIIPVMIRLAPHIGMMDSPDSRKVHQEVIPRSGGVGIVTGMIVPLFIWLELDSFTISFLTGAFVLLVFGAWDDSKNIRPIYKFIGQVIAASVVVYYGGIYVYHFPFLGLDYLPAYIGKPFTVLAIVGMINALNLSDGLDGLAGGEALISLVALAYMAYQYEGATAIVIAATTIGGIFGFLRFNSHPARIFMGDSGSQTLGFVLGVLTVYLTQNVNPVISPVIPLLILGLPLVDSLVVFYMRAKRGVSLVTPSKEHLHHRLMSIGFFHYESVMMIYTLQALLVFVAVLIPYESDFLISGVYLSFCFILYGLLVICEKNNYSIHKKSETKQLFLPSVISRHEYISRLPLQVLESGLIISLISAPLMSENIPIDISISSTLMLVILLMTLFGILGIGFYRLVIFISLGSSVYLLSEYPPPWLFDNIEIVYLYYLIIAASAFIAVRLRTSARFRITPLDYLVLIIALVVATSPDVGIGSSNMTWMAIQMIILFYSAELLIQKKSTTRNHFSGVLVASLVLIVARGLL